MTVSRIPEGKMREHIWLSEKGGFMVLDIILVAILVFFAAKGLAKGFVYTCLHTLGWIAAIVLAWFAAKPLADILDDGSLGMSIRDSLTEKFAMSTAALDNAVAGMPAIIRRRGSIRSVRSAADDDYRYTHQFPGHYCGMQHSDADPGASCL